MATEKIVRMTGFGVEKPNAENELPIDINYQKLVDWLNTRKKLPADWHKRVQVIQAKVVEAVKELPPGLLTQLPGGSDAPMDYFRCKMVRDKLAETADRSLFGGLTGSAGVWDKIVKAYEKDSVYVGEAAQAMIQNVDFEVPYLRKQAAKYSQQIADGEKRNAEYTKSAATSAANYKQECAKLGIPGVNVSQELLSLTSRVPELLEALLGTLRQQQLGDAIAYYASFTEFAHQPAAAGSSSTDPAGMLETLRAVRDGTTVVPAHLQAAVDAANNATGGTAASGISWGLGEAPKEDAGSNAAGGGISWDLGVMSVEPGGSEGAAAGISWALSAEDTGAEPAAAVDATAAAASGVSEPALDWGISMDDAGAGSSAGGGGGASISWDIELTDAAAEGEPSGMQRDWGSAADLSKQQSSSARVLETLQEESAREAAVVRLERDSDYRAQLQDDLQELRAFLLHRAAELKGGSSDLLNTLLPPGLQEVDVAGVSGMLGVVEGAFAALNNQELRQLQLIGGSQRYLERLTSSLERKQGQEAKMLAAAAEAKARQHEARAALAATTPKVSELVARTKQQKAEVEAAISRMLGGRRVNILGEINNVLAASA